MLQHNCINLYSPERNTRSIDSIVGDDKPVQKPNCMNKPSNFSIDHILNSAGCTKDKYLFDNCQSSTNDFRQMSDNKTDFFLMDNNTHQYPPILNWLQYTRYKPPRLPRPTRIGPVKRTPGRLPRIPFSPHQLNELEMAYRRANYLSSEDANKLAMQLELTCVRVKIWFQNRRARERREKRELSTSTSSPS